MKKRALILFLLIMPWLSILRGQKIITLRECYDKASAAAAFADEKTQWSDIWQLRDRNLSKGWLPSLDANGSFAYNSEVIDLGSVLGKLPIPGLANAIKPLPNEQYKMTLDINQVIWDGGAIKSARALEKSDMTLNQKQTEVDLYKTRSQVNTYYFNLLLLSRQRELLKTYIDLIDKRITSMQSSIDNGIRIKSDGDVLASEKLKLEQQLKENEITSSSLLKLLSDITGIPVDTASQFIIPLLPAELSRELARPELAVFDLRREQLNTGLRAIESSRMPKAFGFATLGYGNPPGNNFLKNEFAPYYLVGAGIKWNIFDWNQAKNEKRVNALQQQVLENRKSDLAQNLNRLLEAKQAEIESLRTLLETDNDLVALRKRITASAESQYENGTITATEYMDEMDSEREAVINREVHKVNLALAQVEFINISGRDIE
ncbi:MAG: TolC family protein [Bacteroidales bacterium]|jgi:outer membrane protein TolC